MTILNEKDSPEKATYGITFSKCLKELREARRLRQNTVAQACGVPVATYANWEQGRTLPPINHIPQLADFFEVSTEYLLGVSKRESADRIAIRLMSLPENYRTIVETLIDQILKDHA